MPSSWLFVRGGESIRIVRPNGCVLIINGPGAAQERHDFGDEDEVQAYQMSIAEELAAVGWLLEGVDRERRSGQDRRGVRRGTPDRRRAAAL
jgi:hypothetical protein